MVSTHFDRKPIYRENFYGLREFSQAQPFLPSLEATRLHLIANGKRSLRASDLLFLDIREFLGIDRILFLLVELPLF